MEGFARDGLNDEQLALKLGISVSTYYQWQIDHPEFSEAIKKGKAPVDFEVENALLKRAKGYITTETVEEMYRDPATNQITSQHIRRITREIPPDVGAIVFWLKNRKPERWRDKPIEVEDRGTMEKLDQMLAEVRKNAFNAQTG